MMGTLYLLSGPFGVGKSTLREYVTNMDSAIESPISYTSRPRRQGECDGIDYHFISKDSFLSMIDRNMFFESQQIFSHHYGYLKSEVLGYLKQGKDVILDVDFLAVRLIKQHVPQSVSIFIMPSEPLVLSRRIIQRDGDSASLERLKYSDEIIKESKCFDYLLVNHSDGFMQCANDFWVLIKKNRNSKLVASSRPCFYQSQTLLGFYQTSDSYQYSSAMMNNIFFRVYKEGLRLNFEIMLASCQLLTKFGRGKVILLYGASTTGKTSICRQFMSQAPQWISDGNDLAMERRYKNITNNINAFKHYFPEHYWLMASCMNDEAIIDALQHNKYSFNSDSLFGDQILVRKTCNMVKIIEEMCVNYSHLNEAQLDLFDRCFQASSNGISVILDTLDFENFFLYKTGQHFNCPIQFVLVFCDELMLSKRIDARNRSAENIQNYDDCRYGPYPFFQQISFFTPCKNDKKPRRTLRKKELLELIAEHSQHELDKNGHNIDLEEQKKLLQSYEGYITQQLSIQSDAEFIEIRPKYYNDYFLDTTDMSARDCADVLLKRNICI